MWPDNETNIDLLGFDFLVDELLVLLKEPRLLPVTIGVTGDWGSGKSSLLAMAAKQLGEDKEADFIVIEFSPWKFEGYEDVKAALMQAVMLALQKPVAADKTNVKKTIDLFLRLVGRVKWFTIARTAGAAVLAAQGAPPEMATLLAGGWIDTSDLEKAGETTAADLAPASVADFRKDFESLMEGLETVQGLVVFVDDVDRCMPDTIIDTFEAIRLFLHVPKTAYVIAADQRIVQGAIEDQYKTAVAKNSSIGRDYLEKILQVTVAIPPLSTPEAESYINLLMADAFVTPEVMSTLRDAAKVERSKGYLAVCMNEGIAKAALGNVPEELSVAFAVASRISPTLARKHHGNPRQIKRFMNTLMLRKRAADRRRMNLDIAVLAKLMILGEVDPAAYATLFAWQGEAGGTPVQMAQAETYAKDGAMPAGAADEVASWADRPEVKPWLTLEPALAKVDLGGYFFFSRDRFSPALPAARLTPEQQALLVSLQADSDKILGDAVAAAVALPPEDLAVVYPALLAIARADADGRAMDSAILIGSKVPAAAGSLTEALGEMPAASVPAKLVPILGARFKGTSTTLDPLFDAWATGTGPLAKAAAAARKPKTAKGRRA